MRIHGACHCGLIAFDIDWPDDAPVVPRACGCTFCRKHGAAWTAHAAASLVVDLTEGERVSHYQFGTQTAQFLVCTRCGVVPVCISDIDGRLHAVVNVNTFEGLPGTLPAPLAVDFDGEDEEARSARRARGWIGAVTVRQG